MKKEIYETMKNVIGWSLYDLKDFENTTQYDLNNLTEWWSKLDNFVDTKEEHYFTLQEIEDLRDSIGFIIDFVRSVAIIENSKQLKEKNSKEV